MFAIAFLALEASASDEPLLTQELSQDPDSLEDAIVASLFYFLNLQYKLYPFK